MIHEQLIETWQVHARINHYMLHYLPAEALAIKHKGRTPGEHLAHMHNVRLMWLEQAAPALLTGLEKFDKKTGGAPTLQAIEQALQASDAAMAALLTQGLAAGKIKGFKPHPVAFLGYIISHESHHRGQILLNLRLSGFELDKKMTYGLWEWGVR